MKPKTNGRQIQLSIIDSLYKTEIKTIKNEDGSKKKFEREKFIREVFTNVWFCKNDLSPYGEYIGSKGQIVKTRCKIYDRSSGKFYTVKHSMNEVHNAINETTEVGFKK